MLIKNIKFIYAINKITSTCRMLSTVAQHKIKESSVDPKELAHFDKYSDIWWDKDGKAKGLHNLNKIRLPFIKDGLNERGILQKEFANSPTPFKNLNILDIGCGGGILSEALALQGANVTGVDISPNLINCAKEHANTNPKLIEKIKYICSPLEDIAEEYTNKFDVVIGSELLDHVASKEVLLKSCVHVLKPNGSLILSTINQTFRAWFVHIFYAEYFTNLAPKGTHHWKKLVQPKEVKEILLKNNCEVIFTKGYSCVNGFRIEFHDWHWVDNTNESYFMHAIKKTV